MVPFTEDSAQKRTPLHTYKAFCTADCLIAMATLICWSADAIILEAAYTETLRVSFLQTLQRVFVRQSVFLQAVPWPKYGFVPQMVSSLTKMSQEWPVIPTP